MAGFPAVEQSIKGFIYFILIILLHISIWVRQEDYFLLNPIYKKP